MHLKEGGVSLVFKVRSVCNFDSRSSKKSLRGPGKSRSDHTPETSSHVSRARGLHSRACFKRDNTRWDWQSLPELAGLGQDYFFMVPLFWKIGKNPGKIWEIIREAFRNSQIFPDQKQETRWEAGRDCSQMLRTLPFSDFYGKNLVPVKVFFWAF